jgi:hypothetical protein
MKNKSVFQFFCFVFFCFVRRDSHSAQHNQVPLQLKRGGKGGRGLLLRLPENRQTDKQTDRQKQKGTLSKSKAACVGGCAPRYAVLKKSFYFIILV